MRLPRFAGRSGGARGRLRRRAFGSALQRFGMVACAAAQLRFAVFGGGNDRGVRRQSFRSESHFADSRRGAAHRRFVGRQVYENRDMAKNDARCMSRNRPGNGAVVKARRNGSARPHRRCASGEMVFRRRFFLTSAQMIRTFRFFANLFNKTPRRKNAAEFPKEWAG